jgi:hypothetical protein
MSNLIEEIHKSGRNPSAMAASYAYMDETAFQQFGFFDEWVEIKCQDGSKALVLKNPNKAFDIYAKEWSTKVNGLVDVANQVKVEASTDINSKIVKLFDNLGSIEAILREMYKNAYLTFAASPCSEKAQDSKIKMDKILMVIGASILLCKLNLENSSKDPASLSANVEKINTDVINLISKIGDLMFQ